MESTNEAKRLTIRSKNPESDFISVFGRLSKGRDEAELWNDFILMSSCVISNSRDVEHRKGRIRRQRNLVGKYSENDQLLLAALFALVELALKKDPNRDFLGMIHQKIGIRRNGNSSFSSSEKVSLQVARIIFGSNAEERLERDGGLVLSDPACGSGAAYLAMIGSMRKSMDPFPSGRILCDGGDEDEKLALMCYIQLSLIGIPCTIRAGSGDDRDRWLSPAWFGSIWSDSGKNG